MLPQFFIDNNLGLQDAVDLWNHLVSHLKQIQGRNIHLIDIDYLDYNELIHTFSDFKTLCNYLKELFVNTLVISDNQNANTAFEKLLAYVNSNYTEEIYLKELSARYYINLTYCCELFKKVTGKTFSNYVTTLRMKKASDLLIITDLSIDEISTKSGYNDYHYFSNNFKKYFNVSPTTYRKTNSNEDVKNNL